MVPTLKGIHLATDRLATDFERETDIFSNMNEGHEYVLLYPPGKTNHPFGQNESEGICRMRMKMIQHLLLLTTAPLPFDGGKYV